LPPNIVDTVQHWIISGDYVNEPYAYSATCNSYRKDSDLQTNMTTGCWFVNGSGGSAGIAMNLHMSNGQYVNVAANGNYTIYKPSFSPITPLLNDIYFSFPYLNADMSWRVTVNSKYDGQYGITQLLLGTGIYYGTGGQYILDGSSEIYGEYGTNGPSPYTADDPSTHGLRFQDSPRVPAYSMNLKFKDYLRFQPNGGIYVTIAKNGWHVKASASLSGVVTPSTLPPATPLVDSDEFPVWNSIRSGGGGGH